MPFETGIEVLKEIRAIDTEVPVVIITTEGKQNKVVEAVQAGVKDYILKPFDSDTLKQKLEKNPTQLSRLNIPEWLSRPPIAC